MTDKFEPGDNATEGLSNSFADKQWLNPLAVVDLRDAVLNHAYTVKLNGRIYTINYKEAAVDDHGVITGRVFVRVMHNYAPCGWFSINELMNYEFEADHDKHL